MESKLIRIGNRIVSPSLITYAECTKDGKRVTVHLVTSSDRSNEKDVELTFSAQEAKAMWEEWNEFPRTQCLIHPTEVR